VVALRYATKLDDGQVVPPSANANIDLDRRTGLTSNENLRRGAGR
jgi:hypothetical protein